MSPNAFASISPFLTMSTPLFMGRVASPRSGAPPGSSFILCRYPVRSNPISTNQTPDSMPTLEVIHG